jgi:hypothetical protein
MMRSRESDEARTAARWREFLQHIWEEAADQGRDADAFMQPDLAARTIRARLFTDETGDTSFAVTISAAQLLEGDLRDLARRFLAAYIAAYDASWPER